MFNGEKNKIKSNVISRGTRTEIPRLEATPSDRTQKFPPTRPRLGTNPGSPYQRWPWNPQPARQRPQPGRQLPPLRERTSRARTSASCTGAAPAANSSARAGGGRLVARRERGAARRVARGSASWKAQIRSQFSVNRPRETHRLGLLRFFIRYPQ